MSAIPPRRRILSTLEHPRRAVWTARVDSIDRNTMPGVEVLRRLVTTAHRYEAIVLNGAIGLRAGYVDLIAAGILARRSRGPAIVISECTWGRGASPGGRLGRRIGSWAIDGPRVTYCVLSHAEQRLFPEVWGMSPDRVAYTPYLYTLSEEELAAPTSADGSVFAGGDPMRDYGPLVAAAREIAAPITIAARRLPPSLRRRAPANVTAGPVPHARFLELMRRASVVVVPLVGGLERSAGQQSYLNAMALGKLVVVTDSVGVRDHIEPERTGLLVPPGDAKALAAAIHWALDPANHQAVKQIAAQGRETALSRFGPENYVTRLLELVDEVTASG